MPYDIVRTAKRFLIAKAAVVEAGAINKKKIPLNTTIYKKEYHCDLGPQAHVHKELDNEDLENLPNIIDDFDEDDYACRSGEEIASPGKLIVACNSDNYNKVMKKNKKIQISANHTGFRMKAEKGVLVKVRSTYRIYGED